MCYTVRGKSIVKNKSAFSLIILFSLIMVVTIFMAIFVWMYNLQIIAKSGLYGVEPIYARSFFANNSFPEIVFVAIITLKTILEQQFLYILLFVIAGILCIQIFIIIIVHLKKKSADESLTTQKLGFKKYLSWCYSNYKVTFWVTVILFSIKFLFFTNFGINHSFILSLQTAILDNGGQSQYCNILQNESSTPQVLKVNLENNYKLSWTYNGLEQTSLTGTNPYYPNKIDATEREKLIKQYCSKQTRI